MLYKRGHFSSCLIFILFDTRGRKNYMGKIAHDSMVPVTSHKKRQCHFRLLNWFYGKHTR